MAPTRCVVVDTVVIKRTGLGQDYEYSQEVAIMLLGMICELVSMMQNVQHVIF